MNGHSVMPVRTPFVTITLIGESGNFIDLTDFVTGINVERAVKKNDLLEIQIKYDYSVELMDNPDFIQGAEIRVQYGYIKWRTCAPKTFFITDIDPEYSTNVELTVKASDKGVGMKKFASGRIWKNMTISDIVISIAKAHGLTYNVEKTAKVYESIPQGQQPDYAFIKYLAALAGDDYQGYVTEAQLYFNKRDLLKKSVVTYEYGNYEVISFSPRWDEKSASSATDSVASVGFDKANMQALAGYSDNDTNKDVVLGDKAAFLFNGTKVDPKLAIKEISDLVPKEVADKISKASKVISNPAQTTEELEKASKSAVSDAKLKLIKGTITVQGNPYLVVGDIVTLSGFAYCHNGNWYVEGIKDAVGSDSGYITTLEVKKNALMRTTKGKAQQNKTIGTGDNDKEVKQVYFDLDGNKL